jgi:hypothetical protein
LSACAEVNKGASSNNKVITRLALGLLILTIYPLLSTCSLPYFSQVSSARYTPPCPQPARETNHFPSGV